MHHLTLAELAVREELSEPEAWEKCRELGVPVLHGRVDRALFEAALREPGKQDAAAAGSSQLG